MASIYGAYNNYTRLRIDYSISQSIEHNNSGISLYLYAERTKNSHQFNNSGQSFWSLSGTGNNYANFDWAANSSELFLGSTTLVVAHNTDGTAETTLSGYWYTGRTGSSYIPEALSISQKITLPTIPRASSVSGGSGNIGETTTISISRASTSFTHTLRYVFGSLSGTIATGVGTSYTWTIPTSFYEQIPSNPNGVGTIYCDTYSGSTLVGTKTTSFTATADKETCKPTVSATIKDTNSTTIALTGNANKLIRYKSTAQLVITSTPKNSAKIKSVTVNGATVGTSNSITLNYSNVSTDNFAIIATDTREYPSSTVTVSPSYVNYVPLTVNANFFRPRPTDSEIQLTYSGNYFDGNFGAKQNSVGIEWHYRVKGSSTWIKGGNITPTISENKIVEQTISLGTNFDYQTAYEFYIYAQDYLTSFSTTASVSVGMPVFYWGKDFLDVNGDLRKNGLSTDLRYAQVLTPTDGTPLEATDGGGELQHTRICSMYANNNHWWNMINIRHQNGEGVDGTKFGMQIVRSLTDLNGEILTRAQSNHIWTGWETIYRAKALWDNMSGTTGTVTLSETAANFSYLEIFFKTNDSTPIYSSSTVYSPNGKVVNLEAMNPNYNSTAYLKSKTINISGTSITNVSYSELGLSSSGVNFGAGNVIYITRVVGYR